ncbi:MAG: UbiA family prenyltransferase [Burkholderiaceae bacterium]
MNFATAMQLGRVSNLPTVWTNTIAGAALAGAATFDLKLFFMLLAMSLFYVGGMFLNDAYDADIDATERPERPIPAGTVTRSEVFVIGYKLLAVGVLLLFGVGVGAAFQPGTGAWPAVGGIALGAAIIAYNKDHKNNVMSPFVMGLCRVLVYVSAALCIVTAVPAPVYTIAVLALCHLIGLTYVAKQENLGSVKNMWPLLFFAVPVIFGFWQAWGDITTLLLWVVYTGWLAYAIRFLFRRNPGDIPRAVISLIAGISLLDAMMISGAGHAGLAFLAVAAFLVTLALQRFVSGT